jgi:leader peptidase (prepilin peptidase)/N-methyltransferase
LISFVWLRGRCRGCKASISWQYPLVEALSGALFVVAWAVDGRLLPSLVLGLCLWLFALCAILDYRTQLLPDALTLPLLLLGIGYAVLSPPFPIFAPLLGAGFFALQWGWSRGRWVGSGDILIGAAMGFLLLDWRMVAVALGVSYIIGAVIALVLLFGKKKGRGDHLPFVPFLALGTLTAVLLGNRMVEFLRW